MTELLRELATDDSPCRHDLAVDPALLEEAIRAELEALWGEPTEPAMRRAVVLGISQRYARLEQES